ncbi:MAG TPA: Coagulation factor 5/8 type domain-containing protein [Solirubrobacteraceae bacterium]
MRRIVLAALGLALLAAPSAQAQENRFALAGGCWNAEGVADTVRFQATALGRYLLYTPDRKFVTGAGIADAPSPAAEWDVTGDPGAFSMKPLEGGEAKPVSFTPASGCAEYPEAPLNATGAPQPSETEFERVGGLVEGHMHWMTFEYFGRRFHCGRPWHKYGIPYALPDCAEYEGPNGTAAPLQNTLNYGNPAQPHDTSGYPKLTEWSKDNLTYEGTYWRWIERAHLAGLRLMVMGINENRVLCELQERRETNCNEMDTVRRGIKAIHELQDYVDAQAGGPGKGFFQIVTDPFEARRIINSGRMAVVIEIEISEPFDCRGWNEPTCDQAQVDRQLDEMHGLGVRSMLLLNKFDNPLTGVRFDSGEAGVVINEGNRQSAGTYWEAQTCQGPLQDNEIFQPTPAFAPVLNAIGLGGGTAPTYPPAPHCNTRGLTDLGKHVVERMMDKQMIVNPDHMSQAGVADTLSLLEARRYSGVISPHGWMDPGNWPRLWKLGGVAFPGHSAADDYVKEWKEFRPERTPYQFGWGYGADLGGLSHQPSPNEDGKGIDYPFKSYDGSVTFDRQKTGDREFDYTKEGVAHYGLYADWLADLQRQGGDQMVRDMWDGAEAYLDMWERASGIRVPDCTNRDGVITKRGRGVHRLGTDWRALLERAGQPQQRTRAWTWCVKGVKNATRQQTAVLSPAGFVELVGSNALRRRAGGIPVGAKVSKRRALRRAKRVGGGVRRRGTFVYVVRRGRVRAVGVATKSLVRRPAALRAAARLLRTAKAAQPQREFVPNPEQAKTEGRLTGRALAGTSNKQLNDALALLCSLQVQGASPRAIR